MAHRPRAWADTLIDQNLTATNVAIDLLTPLAASDTITVARLVIHLWVTPLSLTQQIDGITKVDFGIGVAAGEAFAAGIGALPDPGDATKVPARGWLWADTVVITKVHSTGTTYEAGNFPETRADIGAMRKVDRGILYLMLAMEQIIDDLTTVQVVGRVRALCLT